MSVITDITEQSKNKKRVNLYIDGQFFSGVEKIVLLSENLHVGDAVDEKKLALIIEESEYTSCFQKASGYILKGGHTVKQVAGYLKDKGFDGKIIAKVIDKLQEYDYLNDAQFAKTYVELKSHKYGRHYLTAELRRKGVSEKDADAAVCAISEKDEDENAFFVAKKYIKNRPLDIEVKQKCFRYLLSKGFSYDSAKSALDKLCRDEEDY